MKITLPNIGGWGILQYEIFSYMYVYLKASADTKLHSKSLVNLS